MLVLGRKLPYLTTVEKECFLSHRTLPTLDRECSPSDRDLLAVRVDPETRELVLLVAKRPGVR